MRIVGRLRTDVLIYLGAAQRYVLKRLREEEGVVIVHIDELRKTANRRFPNKTDDNTIMRGLRYQLGWKGMYVKFIDGTGQLKVIKNVFYCPTCDGNVTGCYHCRGGDCELNGYVTAEEYDRIEESHGSTITKCRTTGR